MVWPNEANWQRPVGRNGESVFFSANPFSNFGQNLVVVGGQQIGNFSFNTAHGIMLKHGVTEPCVVVQGKCQGSLFSDSVSVPPRHRYFQLMAIHTSSGPAVAD
jgi:hypothetical protein